jgi:pimeloyl-ACP methyl ester carboxylesterase
VRRALSLILLVSVLAGGLVIRPAQAHGMVVQVLDAAGQPQASIVDGNLVRVRVDLEEPAARAEVITFRLAGSDSELGSCQVPARRSTCTSETVSSLGWYWEASGEPGGGWVIEAYEGSERAGQSVPLEVKPRPVVMVHGFSSSWEAWQTYLGPDGFLAGLGIQGFAVGDGQVEGVLNTGSITAPEGRTNTIAENAAITGEYIARVKAQTGAEMVDLLAHSMGGLISRYYIGRVMQERDVAQLIMLGSPMAGTECAYLPSALGYYLPAVLEIRPTYVTGIFNRQVTERHGVPFHAVAGVPITQAVKSPCTPVPSDIVISRESISAIPLTVTETTFLHTDLNRSPEVFQDAVAPLLKAPPGGFGEVSAQDSQPSAPLNPLQFTRIFSGHLLPGESETLTIPIEAGLTLARFALFDSSRSLRVEVRGASGNVIELSAEAHGLTVVDDPSTLVYLGYGFPEPRAGEWKVTLLAGEKTPPEGTSFALTAVFDGGAALEASTSTLLPEPGESVRISARITGGDPGLQVERAAAVVQPLDGSLQVVELIAQGDIFTGSFTAEKPGLYAIEVEASGRLPDGTPVERIAFLVVEAQPEAGGQIEPLLIVAAAIALLVLGLGAVWWRSRAGKKNHPENRINMYQYSGSWDHPTWRSRPYSRWLDS